jgi:hypothetical protein
MSSPSWFLMMVVLLLLLMMMMMIMVVVTTVIITMSVPRRVELRAHLFVQQVVWCNFIILLPTPQTSGASKAK